MNIIVRVVSKILLAVETFLILYLTILFISFYLFGFSSILSNTSEESFTYSFFIILSLITVFLSAGWILLIKALFEQFKHQDKISYICWYIASTGAILSIISFFIVYYSEVESKYSFNLLQLGLFFVPTLLHIYFEQTIQNPSLETVNP